MRFVIFLALVFMLSGCDTPEPSKFVSRMELGTVIETGFVPAQAWGDSSMTRVKTERGTFYVYSNKMFLVGEQIIIKKRADGWGFICIKERNICHSAGFQ